jgi:hypothetical protein
MRPNESKRSLITIFLISQVLFSTAIYAWDVITAIPTYPQHSQIVSAYHQGIDNINVFSDQSGMVTISNPANLTVDEIKTSVSISVIGEEGQTAKFQPGSMGAGWKLTPNLGIGLAYSGHMVEQSSPNIRLNDESGKTGLDGLNVGYEDIHSEGGRHWFLAGIGYQLSENHRIGLSTGFVFGDLKKTAQFFLYKNASSSTVVDTFTQTNKHRYRVVPLVIGYSGDFTDRWNFSFRFMTPFSDTVTIHSRLSDEEAVVFQSKGYEKESHVFAHDSEFELGARFSANDLTRLLLTVGAHDNVFFGKSSWENLEIRFGVETKLEPYELRFGGHLGIPDLDDWIDTNMQAFNRDAYSSGISAGVGIPLDDGMIMDVGIGFRTITFETNTYQRVQASAGIRF